MKENFLVKAIRLIVVVIALFLNTVLLPKDESDITDNTIIDTDSLIEKDVHDTDDNKPTDNEAVQIRHTYTGTPAAVSEILKRSNRINHIGSTVKADLSLTKTSIEYTAAEIYVHLNNIPCNRKGTIRIREPTIIHRNL